MQLQSAVAMIVAGTLVAGWESLNTDIFGYAITMANNFFTAAGSVMVRNPPLDHFHVTDSELFFAAKESERGHQNQRLYDSVLQRTCGVPADDHVGGGDRGDRQSHGL
jgi:hypothetical protein